MGLTNLVTTRLGFKSQLMAFIIVAFSLLSVSHVAEAKRFGGGGSFGFQKKVAPKNYNTPSKQTAPASTPASKPAAAGAAGSAAKSGASKWLGPLAGIAAGGLLAAMLFGDGFEGIQLFDILLFALIAFVLFKIFTSRARRSQQGYEAAGHEHRERYEQPQQQEEVVQTRQAHTQERNQSQPAYEPNAGGSIFGADLEDGMGQGTSPNAHFFNEVPAWFDEAQFVEGAKSHFMALQNAWDNVDLEQIKSYCTDELYQALVSELKGVQPGDNQTRVDELNAETAAIAVDGEYLVVSIRFTGFIKEDAQGAHAFNEIWHIRRLANDEGNWRVAGIQQSSQIV